MAYTWEGMQIISYEEAIKMYKENKEVYRVYEEDDSEGLAESLEEIHDHYERGGIFGFSKHN